MARETQIIPQYKFPFVETYYNDYSGWADTEPTPAVISGFQSMCFFAASKGIDNKLVTKYSLSEFFEEYGQVNFKLYGQPMLQAYNMLSSGEAIVHCMRVLPADANYSNVTVVAKVKIEKVEAPLDAIQVPNTFKATAVTTPANTEEDPSSVDTYAVTLTWDAVTDATGYEICINNETGNIITVNGVETYTHDNLVLDAVYNYKVRTVTSTGTSEWSNVATITAGATDTDAVVTVDDIPNTNLVPDKMLIRFQTIAEDALRSVASIETAFDEIATETDDEGWLTVPLITLYSLGRGIYGNNYAFRIVDSQRMTEEYGTNMQQIELYDTTDGFNLKERFYVSFDPANVSENTSLFAADIITDADNGSTKIGAYGNEDAFDTIFTMYKEAFPDVDIDAADFNFITGLETDGRSYVPNLEIVVPGEGSSDVSLSEAYGISFAYGSDGSFAAGTGLETAIEECCHTALSGEYDTGIISRRRYPTDVILDANFSLRNKVLLAQLGLDRGDCQVVIDAGIISTIYEVTTWADSAQIVSMDDWAISKVFQNAVVKDPFTGRRITVTAPYFYSLLMPSHYQNNLSYPMVGEDYGRCIGIIGEKLIPMVEYDDKDIKTKLVERRLNWIEAIGRNTFVIGSQYTSMTSNSDLNEMNNVAVLLSMKRDLEELCIKATYKFAEADDRERYTKQAMNTLEKYQNMCREYNVYFDMNSWEEQRSILHCYLSVTFKTIVKNCIIEIDINSRV